MKAKLFAKAVRVLLLLLLPAIYGQAQTWNVAGNTGVTSSQYLGTKDKADLIFKTKGIERGRLLGTGGVWRFGTSTNYAKIDSLGKLSFAGTGSYLVAGSKYVFQYATTPNYGLFFNASPLQYEFRNSSASPVFTVNASTGAGIFKSTVKIGAYTLPATDGTSGQVLKTNGSGGVTWGTVTGVAGSWQLGGNAGTNPTSQFIGTTDSKDFVIRTANKERVRVSSAGNVGIGVTKPQTALQVIGTKSVSLTSSGYVQIGDSAGSNIGIDYNQIQSRYNGSYSPLYINYNGGTVYLGNTINSYYGSVSYGRACGAYGYGSNYGVYGYSTGGSGLYGMSSYTYGKGVYGYANGGVADAVHGEAVGSSDYGGYFTSTSSVGLYAATSNTSSYAGYFSGNVYSTGAYQGSDQKLKQDIKEVTSAMDIINQLHPKLYNYRHDGSYKYMNLPEGQHYGLIAQEVEKVLPNLVKATTFDVDRVKAGTTTPANDKPVMQQPGNVKPVNPPAQAQPAATRTGEVIDYKAVNYTELIPIAIKGMQEQEAKINQQQQTIATLQETISNQQQQIDELKTMVRGLVQGGTIKSGGSIEQNIPNPSGGSTTIRYSVPQSARRASLLVTDAAGKSLQQVILQPGAGVATIDASALNSGAYSYTLLVDGKTIATKKMVVARQ